MDSCFLLYDGVCYLPFFILEDEIFLKELCIKCDSRKDFQPLDSSQDKDEAKKMDEDGQEENEDGEDEDEDVPLRYSASFLDCTDMEGCYLQIP